MWSVHRADRRVASAFLPSAGGEPRSPSGQSKLEKEKDGRLHPRQQAFLEPEAFQCAYCTSRMNMSGLALLFVPNLLR